MLLVQVTVVTWDWPWLLTLVLLLMAVHFRAKTVIQIRVHIHISNAPHTGVTTDCHAYMITYCRVTIWIQFIAVKSEYLLVESLVTLKCHQVLSRYTRFLNPGRIELLLLFYFTPILQLFCLPPQEAPNGIFEAPILVCMYVMCMLQTYCKIWSVCKQPTCL